MRLSTIVRSAYQILLVVSLDESLRLSFGKHQTIIEKCQNDEAERARRRDTTFGSFDYTRFMFYQVKEAHQKRGCRRRTCKIVDVAPRREYMKKNNINRSQLMSETVISSKHIFYNRAREERILDRSVKVIAHAFRPPHSCFQINWV
jgi:hypothetical protein